MAIMDFLKKQFIDVIEWQNAGDDLLMWQFPMQDQEIQNGGSLTVRESQLAAFVDEGRFADVFSPGRHTLNTNNLPLLTNLKNWDKMFQSPFKSDVFFFNTRQQLDHKWGTPQAITIRDKDFGSVRLRAFGNYAFRVADPKRFFTEVTGVRSSYRTEELEGQLRGMLIQGISDTVAESGIPFLDLAANLNEFADAISLQIRPKFEPMGIELAQLTVQNVSLPQELQKIMDQRIGMGMVGDDMGKFMQYQTGQAIPAMAAGGGEGGGSGGVAGDAMGLGAGMAMGQMMANQLQQGLAGAQPQQGAQQAAPAQQSSAVEVKPEEITATLEKLHELHTKGILTAEEFESKKTELLKKLV